MFLNDKSTLFLLFVLVLINLRGSFAEISFELSRLKQDKFKNPTVNYCGKKGKEFCEQRNSQCDWSGSGGCCYCICGLNSSTFDQSRLRCITNAEFREGCNLTSGNGDGSQPVKLLDLSKRGSVNVVLNAKAGETVTSCRVKSVVFFQDGKTVVNKFIKFEDMDRNSRLDWIAEFDWGRRIGVEKHYHGKIFKVNVDYNILKNVGVSRTTTKKTECFVFKSSGKLNVSTHLLPSPSTVFVPDTVQPTPTNGAENTKVLQGKDHSVRTSSTSNIPETSKDIHSKAGKHGDDQGGNVVVISSAIIVGLLIVAAFLLLFLWTRRRSGNFSTRKQIFRGFLSRGATNFNNPIVMNNPEPIYAVADDIVTPRHFAGNGNAGGECTVSGADNNYTSLDKSIPEYKPSYQCLTSSSENWYEHTPAQNNNSSSSEAGDSGQPTTSESFCRMVDGPEMTTLSVPEEVYHVLEEPTEPGNFEASGRVTPNLLLERVYNVLEDGSEERSLERIFDSEYLVVLPDYEQPLHSPSSNT